VETKLLKLDRCSIKAAKDNPRVFEGYASVFGNVDAHGDIVLPGAFTNTLASRERPVRMRWNHYGPVIGKWTEIKEDDRGLYVSGELTPNHSVASDVAASLSHGAIDGLSIGYRVLDSEKTNNNELLKEVELVEISVVEEPANGIATVQSIKRADLESMEHFERLADAEKFLRNHCGFTKQAATVFVNRVKSIHADNRRDAETKQTNESIAALVAAINKLEV